MTPKTDPSIVLAQFGKIIYQHNEKSPSQLFIVGMSHRDSLTRKNGDYTSRVQAEVYKIGEWLIHNRELQLLLPEGYFADKGGKIKKENVKARLVKRSDCPDPFDMDALEDILSDNKTFVNAEMLLRDNHLLRIRQIEDPNLYEAVGKGISELIDRQKNSCDYLLLKSELDYLQERRTAAILQRIPEIVNAEFRQGNIKGRRAMLTIGLFHVHQIIRYLNNHKIAVYSPLHRMDKGENYIADLNLEKENFGVTIILPRALADDQKILRINRLDKVVKQPREPSLLSSTTLP